MTATDQTRSDQSAAFTRAGLNLIQQAMSIYDGDLRLVVSNTRFKEMFGLPRRLVTPGAGFADTIRFLVETGEYGEVSDVEAFIGDRVEQARTFEPHYMERTRANGRTISVEGHPLEQGGWVAVYTDITAIKRQEALLRARSEELHSELVGHTEELSRANRQLAATIAALEQAQRDLRESDQRMRLATEMTPAHIAHIGADGRYTYSNRRLSTLVPSRPANIVGMHVKAALGPSIHASVADSIAAAFAGRAVAVEFTDDDSGRRLRATFTPDLDPGGKVQGIYVLSLDITEEAQDRARVLQTHKRELAAQLTNGLAHDFANLLTIVLGVQGQLARRADLPEDAKAMVATTRNAALRGGHILDRLSSISGPRVLNPVPTDVRRFLADVTDLCAAAVGERVRIETTTADEIAAPLMLDTGSLQDALLNLILNARDAMGSEGGAITVRVDTVRDTWLRFRVADTGPGFSAAALDHALEPFFTTKSGDHGSGLGLSMVYDFAQLAGGRVRIGNRVAGGAEVTLLLPLIPALATTAPTMILLVDDNDDLRGGIRAMLRDLGHSVIEATSAEEAEALAGIDGIGLVLSDIRLGNGKSGVDLAESLPTGGAPVILMTSLTPEAPDRLRVAGRWPVLSKPFTETGLAAAISATRDTRRGAS